MLIPIKMASVHKHKGTKTSLTTGTMSYKYRKLSEVQIQGSFGSPNTGKFRKSKYREVSEVQIQGSFGSLK